MIWSKLSKYEQQALQYAEKRGIIEYVVKGAKMTYREAFPTEGTYKVTVNLRTMTEESRTKYKRKVSPYINK